MSKKKKIIYTVLLGIMAILLCVILVMAINQVVVSARALSKAKEIGYEFIFPFSFLKGDRNIGIYYGQEIHTNYLISYNLLTSVIFLIFNVALLIISIIYFVKILKKAFFNKE